MSDYENAAPRARISLLDYLQQQGWKVVRDSGREEVAGLCPLHRDNRPSFYVNRRKQVFYCHGCGRGGGLAHLMRWLEGVAESTPGLAAEQDLLEQTYCFYQRQLGQHDSARAYLAKRGIHNTDVIGRMRIGYAPGACLRGFLTRLGYPRQALVKRGLIDDRHGRDCFFRCLTFPLVEAGSLYGRSIDNGICRHRFLSGSKGGLYEGAPTRPGSRILLVEGLLDVAALWQAGFVEANTALGAYLNNRQLSQLCQSAARLVYICFDADRNGSGQRAARSLSIQLRHAGLEALRVALPGGHDPASFFAAGAIAADFQRCLDKARP